LRDYLELSPQVLEWAASQVGGTVWEIARKISKSKTEKIVEGSLSGPQAVKFARLTGTPFGYLFLPTPPESRAAPIADFRTIQGTKKVPLSKNFFDTYDDIDYKQSWYRDFLAESGSEPLEFVGRFKADADAHKVAADMRVTMNISVKDFASLRNASEVFAMLTNKAEAIGILVFKNSIVGSNGNRPLVVDEFRGFVLSDRLAPAIFINGADAPAAWVFTLAHELAHLWIGDSGISDTSVNSQNSHERVCNAIAAEFLVPKSSFLEVWNNKQGHEDTKLEFTRAVFKVSSLVIARRALDLGLISKEKYLSVYEEARHQATKPKGEGGGDYYRTLAVRNSKRFTNRIAGLAASGAISFRDAGQLLNTNPNNVMTYYAKHLALSA
jgi:Zn-dependent peptidase ImmA (M78 family)